MLIVENVMSFNNKENLSLEVGKMDVNTTFGDVLAITITYPWLHWELAKRKTCVKLSDWLVRLSRKVNEWYLTWNTYIFAHH